MSKSIRFYNFIIDSIVFFIVVIIFSITLKDHVSRGVLKYFMLCIYYFYYFIFEFTTGQTIGKMVTKTKVINTNDTKKPSVLAIFIRTISRLIPIDFLSYLFSSIGIHDRLSKTELKKV